MLCELYPTIMGKSTPSLLLETIIPPWFLIWICLVWKWKPLSTSGSFFLCISVCCELCCRQLLRLLKLMFSLMPHLSQFVTKWSHGVWDYNFAAVTVQLCTVAATHQVTLVYTKVFRLVKLWNTPVYCERHTRVLADGTVWGHVHKNASKKIFFCLCWASIHSG